MTDTVKTATSEVSFEEAPASVNTRLKSPNGFIYQWTMRDEKNSNLFFKIKAMEEKWLAEGFTPVEDRKGGFPAKEKDYVPNRVCPKCGSRLINATKKDGSKFIKCETNKWNALTKQSEGCSFIEWPNAINSVQQVPNRANNPADYGDY